jgi:hypothetical protein
VFTKTLMALVLALVAVAGLPGATHAASKHAAVKVHGTVLYRAQSTGQTGNCTCDDKWYTVGLKPGKVTVTLKFVSVALKMGPAYGFHVDLERADRTILGQTQGACWRTTKHCVINVHFTANVDKQGPYYIQVSGSGAEGIAYLLGVQGHEYRVK